MMLFWSLFLISISAFCIFSTNAVSQESNLEKPRERVILSHDGGADDFVAQILLMVKKYFKHYSQFFFLEIIELNWNCMNTQTKQNKIIIFKYQHHNKHTKQYLDH